VATRGRPRKPAEEHYANGTYKPGRHGPLPTVPDPVEAPPEKPADLLDDVSAKWDAVVPPLAHLLRPAHGGLLLELCRWLVRADELDEALAARKPGTKGYSTLLTAASTATTNLLALSQRFGLSPADRAKMKVLVTATTAAPAKPKVATRPRTALDGAPPPQD
jgi:phage terminase small subunit